MNATHIEITLVNETRHRQFSNFKEKIEEGETQSDVFKRGMREYGRCKGKVYIDKTNGESVAIGWTFEKKCKYDDANEFFIQTAWVSFVKVTKEVRELVALS